MVSNVLLSSPKFYQIEYEINPWMHVENRVDTLQAMEEHARLVEIYRKIGLTVEFIPQGEGLPDMVYTANAGFVIGNECIVANFRYPQRRGESPLAEAYFKERGYTVHTLPENIFFEGQGDLFYKDGKFWFGYGKRSMEEAKPYLEDILRQEVIAFRTDNPYYYHLDTCFAPLSRRRVVINPVSFSKEDIEKIGKNFDTVIMTNAHDNAILCCNMVATEDAIVIGEGISLELRRQLEGLGFEVFETPMREFRKGGGSVKCLTLEYFVR